MSDYEPRRQDQRGEYRLERRVSELENDIGRLRDSLQKIESLQRILPRLEGIDEAVRVIFGFGIAGISDDARNRLRNAIVFLLDRFEQREVIGKIIDEWEDLFGMENPTYWEIKRFLSDLYARQKADHLRRTFASVLRTVLSGVLVSLLLFALGALFHVSLK